MENWTTVSIGIENRFTFQSNESMESNLTVMIQEESGSNPEIFEPVRMAQGWRFFWNTCFAGSMFLSICGNLSIIFMILCE